MSLNNMYAKQLSILAIKDHTPRWLNRIWGALALLTIESTPKEG